MLVIDCRLHFFERFRSRVQHALTKNSRLADPAGRAIWAAMGKALHHSVKQRRIDGRAAEPYNSSDSTHDLSPLKRWAGFMSGIMCVRPAERSGLPMPGSLVGG